jgi:peptidyl-prolyl cis-trans isomerase A (cyclophilin A)
MKRALAGWAVAVATAGLVGCGDDAAGDGGTGGGSGGTVGAGGQGAQGGAGATGGQGGCGPDPANPDETVPGTTDPHAGSFSMDEALAGLPMGDGPLRAILTTEVGEITCELYPEQAPNSVANFVGLARGQRAWRDPSSGSWVKRRFYDGLIFHRVIDDFMAQSGDPLGTGFGGPGYQFADELTTLMHQPGTLAYANSGPNTNGSQFYITEVTTDHLDGIHTVFGACSPMTVIETLTAVPTGANDKPTPDVHIQTLEITRCPLE